jgi:hypothetical protein
MGVSKKFPSWLSFGAAKQPALGVLAEIACFMADHVYILERPPEYDLYRCRIFGSSVRSLSLFPHSFSSLVVRFCSFTVYLFDCSATCCTLHSFWPSYRAWHPLRSSRPTLLSPASLSSLPALPLSLQAHQLLRSHPRLLPRLSMMISRIPTTRRSKSQHLNRSTLAKHQLLQQALVYLTSLRDLCTRALLALMKSHLLPFDSTLVSSRVCLFL